MIGDTHERVAARGLDCQPSRLRDILRPQWEWMQGGATLTDIVPILYADRKNNREEIRRLAQFCFLKAVHTMADVWYSIAVEADLRAAQTTSASAAASNDLAPQKASAGN